MQNDSYQKTISIIIPVYKVEKYIRGCLNSIFMQDLDNYEIIVVDDGTPDNSMSIVNEFADKYHNINIVHQENQGLSCARNSGLNLAKGEYVWFVDSDDELPSGCLTYLSEILSKNKVDVLGFDITAFWENDGSEKILPAVLSCKDQNLYHKTLSNRDIIHRVHTAPAQRFIFRRNFIKEHHLRFFPGIIHEDVDFIGKAMFFADTIYLTNKSFYRYLQRQSGSIMTSLNMISLECRLQILKNFSEFKAIYADNYFKRSYIDDYSFKVLTLMMSFKNKELSHETSVFFRVNSSFLRKVAIRGLLANIYFMSFRKVLRALLISISPVKYYKLTNHVKN